MEKDITKKGENNMTTQKLNILNLFIKNNVDENDGEQILETSKKLLEVMKNSGITYFQANIALKCTKLLMKDEKICNQKGAETMKTDREKIKEELFNYIIRVLQGKTSNAKETEMLPVLMETYFRFR